MKALFRVALASAALALFALPAHAQKAAGWRGNWTGSFPDARPVTEWHRIPNGVTAGLAFQAEKPEDGKKGGQPVHWGQPTEWLVIAPFSVGNANTDLEKEQIPDEANLRPNAGDKVGDLEWKLLKVGKFQGTEIDFVDVLTKDGKANQMAYAHTYLWAEKGGKAHVVVDHIHGMKLWVNGKSYYSHAGEAMGLGHVYGISRQRVALQNGVAPEFTIEIRKGWNSLLVKGTTCRSSAWQGMRFCMRITDEPLSYDEKNIKWVTAMPERTNSSPIVVGDRIFTTSEPDELLCVDKNTGKVLWRRTNNFFDALTDEEKKTYPALVEELAPTEAELLQTPDLTKAYDLRRKILDTLVKTDKARFDVKWDGHMASHFGIVGFSTTPVSDGTSVGVFVGNGVVACYDLDGNRRWIKRIPLEQYAYTSSPAIAGSNLVVNCAGLRAFDLKTGEEKWVNKEAWGGVASLIRAVIRGTEVVVTQKGDIVRGSDGKLLWANPHKVAADTGWAPASVVGDVVYLPWGAFYLYMFDFSEAQGDAWQAKESVAGDLAVNKLPNGQWVDRWTAAAPLIHDGVAYCFDIFGIFYAVDLKAKRLLYRQQLEFDSLDSYVHLGASASPTLGGKYIYVINNQGTCYVLQPGPEFKVVAKNQISTTPRRTWPTPAIEILANGAPVFDGAFIYLRGERNLYCIGEK